MEGLFKGPNPDGPLPSLEPLSLRRLPLPSRPSKHGLLPLQLADPAFFRSDGFEPFLQPAFIPRHGGYGFFTSGFRPLFFLPHGRSPGLWLFELLLVGNYSPARPRGLRPPSLVIWIDSHLDPNPIQSQGFFNRLIFCPDFPMRKFPVNSGSLLWRIRFSHLGPY